MFYLPLLDRPICPSFGALCVVVRCGHSGRSCSLRQSLAVCVCRSGRGSLSLGVKGLQGGRSSGMSDVSYIPLTSVFLRLCGVPLFLSASPTPSSFKPACSLSPFSLLPQQYSMQQCSRKAWMGGISKKRKNPRKNALCELKPSKSFKLVMNGWQHFSPMSLWLPQKHQSCL